MDSKAFVFQGGNQDEGVEERTTAYYGGEGYNTGLYVVTPSGNISSNDNYGYLPSPPPPPPLNSRFLYPETAGHLV